jgi:hypothetical protein
LKLLVLLLAVAALADDRDLQRALMQRDQMSAEGERRGELEALHQRQQLEMTVSPQPADYLRGRMAREGEQVSRRPLPLPGRPLLGNDPIPLKGFGG